MKKLKSLALACLFIAIGTIYVLADSWSPGGKIAQNTVLAGSDGAGAAAPAGRALVNNDLPTVSAAKGGTGVSNSFNLTIPATGSADLIDVAQTISAVKTFSVTPLNSSQDLTAGTMTETNKSNIRRVVHRYDWTNAMITALGGVGSGDITICTLPAKTIVTNVYVVITSPDSSANALTVAVGRTGATYIDYIVASDAKAVANTVYGVGAAQRGTNLTGYDMALFTGTAAVKAHFVKTSTNLSTVTACTGTVYIETYTLP